MKLIWGLLAIALLAQCSNRTTSMDTHNNEALSNFHQLQILNLDEDDTIDFKSFIGKKVLLVNVASKCGFTYQYEDLQKLHKKYEGSLIVVGFPSNQFLFQEPGSKEKIREFCTETYGVTFPISTKIKVKGDSMHAVYQWLTNKELNGVDNYKVSWNFNKFLVNENGQLIGYFGSKTKPFDPSLIAAIEGQ